MSKKFRIVDDNHLHSIHPSFKLAKAVLDELLIHSPGIDFYIEMFDESKDCYVKVTHSIKDLVK